MFLGEYKHTIDNKCRLTIPAKFREDLNNQCVIAKGLDGCLTVYPMDEWALVCEKIDAKPSSDIKVRRFKRLFYASASIEILDKQGRLSIPSALMEYAAIDKDVYIVGESNTFELWSAERWTLQQAEEGEDSFEELAGFLGI
ncbi:MAG: division/cell wall cluster transcriptional repressor MraZ [Peptococcaceae bacterium]|nr:division/cell wall cluster transcriptional repressor MraZ [Peptococcaceae bacterium]